MLSFVTKDQYWAAEDAGVLTLYEPDDWWHIKNIQDAIVLHRYGKLTGKRLADVGGSDSRTLRHFGKHNEGYCIDSFEGEHGGIGAPPTIKGVKNVKATLGEFSPQVPRNYFDVVYSISVIEHVPSENMADFFADIHGALKPGGEMMHLIDLYVEDDPAANEGENERLELYRAAFDAGFQSIDGPVMPPGSIGFHCSYATNPDNMMNRWNRSAPSLRPKRLRSQACSLVLLARKV
jgi:hypothetical protein